MTGVGGFMPPRVVTVPTFWTCDCEETESEPVIGVPPPCTRSNVTLPRGEARTVAPPAVLKLEKLVAPVCGPWIPPWSVRAPVGTLLPPVAITPPVFSTKGVVSMLNPAVGLTGPVTVIVPPGVHYVDCPGKGEVSVNGNAAASTDDVQCGRAARWLADIH